jgi:hypothetical protein
LRKNSGRGKRELAKLSEEQEAERRRERDHIKDTDVPVGLQTPIKPFQEGQQPGADLEDEYFGGFHESDHDEPERESRRRRPKGVPKDVPGCEWQLLDGWGWGLFPRSYPSSERDPGRELRDPRKVVWLQGFKLGKSPWGRVWRIDISSRRWAAEPPANSPPFVLQGVKQANQKLPDVVTPEGDRAEDLHKAEQRLALLETPTDPNSGPSRSFARGILRGEKTAFLAQHVKGAIQKAWCRGYVPSKTLEAKRLPKLPKIESKLLPLEPPGKAKRRLDARKLIERLTAAYLAQGGTIAPCPSEWTTRDLNWTIKKYETRSERRVGRPPIGERAMTPAERKRRERATPKLRILQGDKPHVLRSGTCGDVKPDIGRLARGRTGEQKAEPRPVAGLP